MEQLVNYEDWKIYRIQCDCMSAGCCLDLEIQEATDRPPCYTISINQHTPTRLWERIKRALLYVFKGESICLSEIVLQKEEDIKKLSDILSV